MTMAPDPRAGLCAVCAYCQSIRSARGSVFFLCRRAENDPQYNRYPRLPVVRCDGFAGTPLSREKEPR